MTTFKPMRWHLPLIGLLAAAGTQAACAPGFAPLSSSGSTVLASCNPNSSPSSTACRVTSLPGESGYTLTASRSTPIVINDVTVGTFYEKVWRSGADRTLYIFGSRVVMNNAVWDDSLVPFRVNDLFRRSLPANAVAVAYEQNGATTALRFAGRTVQGLDEYDGSQPDRDNTWIAGRIDANGAGNAAAAQSPWVLAKTKAAAGLSSDAFGIRLLNAHATEATEIFLAGYEPTGIPVGGDD